MGFLRDDYLRKMGVPVTVDFYKTAKLTHENVLWEKIFPNASINQAPKSLIYMLGGGSSLFSKVRRRYLPFSTRVLYMPTAFDAIFPQDKERDIYVIGVFLNADMVQSIKDEVYHFLRISTVHRCL